MMSRTCHVLALVLPSLKIVDCIAVDPWFAAATPHPAAFVAPISSYTLRSDNRCRTLSLHGAGERSLSLSRATAPWNKQRTKPETRSEDHCKLQCVSSLPLESFGYGSSGSSSSNRGGRVEYFNYPKGSIWGRQAPPRLPKASSIFSTVPRKGTIVSAAGGGVVGVTQTCTDEDTNKKRTPIADGGKGVHPVDTPSSNTTAAQPETTGIANNGNVEAPPATTSDAYSRHVQVEKETASSSSVKVKVPLNGVTRDADDISSAEDIPVAVEQDERPVGVRTQAAAAAAAEERSTKPKEDVSEDKHPTVFGARGWYSPEQDVPKDSLFSWQENQRDSSSRNVTANASTLQDGKTSEEQDQSQAQGPAAKGNETEAIEDDWSDRRRLLEKWEEYDEVWISMRKEAKAAAEKEPLLVSFIYSTILNQKTLEAAVAFHLANKLAGPNMLSTQVEALVRESFAEVGNKFRRQLRRDIIAVRERDPACESYHDCLLYFKGFQALQTHRVAHWLYNSGRYTLAFYLQSQVNQEFQIDIHPAATFGEGVFIDHGTGTVVGETAVVGADVSMLHRVTLGGSGVKNEQRHPKIGNGVLIGAGACLLGNIRVGAGTQIGAGSLVVQDLPERCVAVGVPAKVLGQGKKRNPALAMRQDFLKEVWHGSDI